MINTDMSMPACMILLYYDSTLFLFFNCYLLDLIPMALNTCVGEVEGEVVPIEDPYFIDQTE